MSLNRSRQEPTGSPGATEEGARAAPSGEPAHPFFPGHAPMSTSLNPSSSLSSVATALAPEASAAGGAQEARDAQGMALTLEVLGAALSHGPWPSSAAEVVSSLSHRLGCLRASLGWVVSGHLRVVALSDGVVLEEGAAMPELSQAMLESVHQQCTLVWPQSLKRATRITLAHQSLFKAQGLSGLVSVPLACQGQVVGVLTLERSRGATGHHLAALNDPGEGRFQAGEVAQLESMAAQLGPLLSLQQAASRSWYARWWAALGRVRQQLADPARRGLRLALGAAGLSLAGALLVPVSNRVTTTARLEGAVQRVLGVAQDGFIKEVHVRPGDVVKEGQVLVVLSDDDLKASQRARQADVAQQENAFAEAFARGDRAQAAQAQARLAEARAQLELTEQQLARIRVVAPFDGVVIAGDLHQQLGAAVKRGDALITLAPGLDWRVVLEVSESEVADLKPGQTAVLRLASRPQQAIALELERVTPVARSTADGVRYEVEAHPSGLGAGDTHLRPGLEGVAKVDLPARPLLWRWSERAWRWLTMAAWTWL